MFRVVARERKKREIDPTVRILQQCIAESAKQKPTDKYSRDRLADLLNFFELAESAYTQAEKLPTSALLKLAKMGDKAFKLLRIPTR